MTAASEVRNNSARNRYELEVDGHLAVAVYTQAPGVVTIVHTEVPQELGGRGVGTALARGVLEDVRRRGLKVVVPEAEDRETVHRVIYDELCHGKIHHASRSAYEGVIRRLVDRGAEGIILGCTEIGLLVGPENAPVPLFDTTEIHARAAAGRALS